MDIKIAGGKFKICKKVGAGSFGQIYMGQNIKTGEEVAIKMETLHAEFPILNYESKLFEKLSG